MKDTDIDLTSHFDDKWFYQGSSENVSTGFVISYVQFIRTFATFPKQTAKRGKKFSAFEIVHDYNIRKKFSNHMLKYCVMVQATYQPN